MRRGTSALQQFDKSTAAHPRLHSEGEAHAMPCTDAWNRTFFLALTRGVCNQIDSPRRKHRLQVRTSRLTPLWRGGLLAFRRPARAQVFSNVPRRRRPNERSSSSSVIAHTRQANSLIVNAWGMETCPVCCRHTPEMCYTRHGQRNSAQSWRSPPLSNG